MEPAVAYKVLNSMQKAIPEQLGKDFTESVGGSVKSGLLIAGLTVGLDILSNIAQRSIEGNAKDKLADINDAEENSSAFNVIATNASN